MNNKVKQHTIGILGGMSTVATGEYYELINQKVKNELGGHHTAEMIISSVDFGLMVDFVMNDQWDEAAQYLSEKAKGLEQAGVESIFLATNTMHIVRKEIKKSISIPFIDIFETVAEQIKDAGLKNIGILGTYPVMTKKFYKKAYKKLGVHIISPTEKQKLVVDQIIFEELTKFKFLPKSKKEFIKVIKKLHARGAEGIILGCTEIKLLIKQEDVPEIPLFDTTELHCQKAADICLGK